MNGEIAQICALTCWANAILKGHVKPSDFEGNNTTEFCASIQFYREKPKSFLRRETKINIANSPIEWFDWLKRENCKRCYLKILPSDRHYGKQPLDERTSVAFSGGGPVWVKTIEFAQNRRISCIGKWEFDNDNKHSNSAWHVNYIIFDDSLEFVPPNIPNAQQKLQQALEAIYKFSHRHKLDYWQQYFETALQTFTDAHLDYSSFDLMPVGSRDDDAVRLMIACKRSWVFGGMGSWNDIYVGDQLGYNKVSDELFQAIKNGIIAATNCSAQFGSGRGT